MKAGTEEGELAGSRHWRRMGDKSSPSSLVSEPRIQDTGAADKSASGRNGQVQAQSALKILQHQLESFQALRQQTLQNVSMVQSEINEILNKNIADVKHPEFNPDSLLLSSTPVCVAMPTWCQELSKNQLHLDKRTMQYSETNPNKIFGDAYPMLSKCPSVGKAETPVQTPREKPILAFKNNHEWKNSASSIFSPPWVGFKTEASSAISEIKGYAGSKDFMAFHACEDEDELGTQRVSSSFRDMKEDNRKTPRHEFPYAFEVQNTSTVLDGKDNDSGYLSEQDPTGKETDMSSEDFKFKRSSELEDSTDELHIAMFSFKENNQTTDTESQNKEFFVKGNMIEKLQLNFLPKTGEDKSFILEHTEEQKKDNQLQLLGTKQEFQNQKVLESWDINAGSDSYCKNSGLLEMSPKEPEPLQKKVVDLQYENIALKKQLKPLTDIIQSLTEQNSKYQKQIKILHEEKSNIQERLVKSDGDCKECIKEVKRLLKKCKELEQQKITLEEKQDQLYAQNQRIMWDLDELRKKDQESHESLAALTQEKGNFVVALGTLESQITPLQEEHAALEEKVSQLTLANSLLEKELEEKQQDIQQLKENEKNRQSDTEAVVRMTESLKEEKLNLEKTLQESTNLRGVLQKELEEAQRERANAEEKLLNECKTTRKETGVLKTNLSNMEKECERLSAVVRGMTEDNWALKKELHEYKQDVSEYKARIRKLSEELLLMENEMRSMENERDVLQFEVSRLHRNNCSLRDQVTTLFSECRKPTYSSGSRRPKGDPVDPTEICEEMSSFQHISVQYNSPEIAEIRWRVEEEEHHKEEGPSNIQQLFSTVSVSCTTSVSRESSFHSAAQRLSALWAPCTSFTHHTASTHTYTHTIKS